MKMLPLLLITCLSLSASAQNWAPFPAEPDAQWAVTMAWRTGDWCWVSESYQYKVESSVDFNSLAYFPITYVGTRYSEYIPNPGIENPCNVWPPIPISGTRGYLRAENGIYYKGWQGGEEIMYDFTLNVGDTIPYFEEDFILDSLESIQFGNHTRIRQWVTNAFGQAIWIVEGIGHIQGLFEPMGDFEGAAELTCYWENGAPVLPNTNHCGYLSVINNSKPTIRISPNPSSGIFRIETPQKSAYRIYDAFGRLVKEGQLAGASEIDISSEPRGIYLISVKNENAISTSKLVKQ